MSTTTTQPSMAALLSSKSNEWYTPSVYVEAARAVMGSIDLDPASCEQANQIVQATHYFTKEQNGLGKIWNGCIWCNPPYGTTNGKSNAGLWIRKLIEEYNCQNIDQAIILVNSNTDTKWFHQLFAYPVCFTEGRINFYTSKMSVRFGHTHGSAFAYLGPNEQKFINIFSQFGTIARRVPLTVEGGEE